MFSKFLDLVNRSGHINLFNGIILFIGFSIAFTLIGIYAYKSDKKK
ncbi:hypothetical protein CPAST_c22460 [Clostridium pasteurianum DSM 525 = ATCC 6013]|uniref:Uncharacterized protein n=1 Tax=Clostridium pasteurianum DSM 525 = ATCC 6013 TaxID=1262449 RepID=A0A0H3J314_CLOPA|nr:hypothetical protein [Clostridium pasteurianum]AJA48316.1 hypothetical protein CPAST_c22460 [Clostridium pasteurianum DSM 525 = ATCC 6013]AJA52304.1 hypothetical protein CLPA_c22460 [Clostridium pasteurianum DSM 525 = ATCC 6013]KRU11686.1 hypothetical protein CP6013_00933 [Clostridium pasteurianum DSM 525 = ATCC 6013]UZW12534.1 hypothetical protein OSC52_11770 [Clostridium pasteurianum]